MASSEELIPEPNKEMALASDGQETSVAIDAPNTTSMQAVTNTSSLSSSPPKLLFSPTKSSTSATPSPPTTPTTAIASPKSISPDILPKQPSTSGKKKNQTIRERLEQNILEESKSETNLATKSKYLKTLKQKLHDTQSSISSQENLKLKYERMLASNKKQRLCLTLLLKEEKEKEFAKRKLDMDDEDDELLSQITY